MTQPTVSRSLDAAGDLDGDGDTDLVSHMPEMANISVWTNSGHGASFTPATIFTRGTASRVLKIVETGAKAKILVYDYTAPKKPGGVFRNELVLLTRMPNGKFSQRTLVTENYPSAWSYVELLDGDGDGILDLKISGEVVIQENRAIHWLPGLAPLKFGRSSTATAARFPLDDQFRIDVDWDGDLDTWTLIPEKWQWTENIGSVNGTILHTDEQLRPTIFPAGLDFNSDGHEDYTNGFVPILANGNGNRNDPNYPVVLNSEDLLYGNFFMSRYSNPSTFIDMDGDGDLDYLAQGSFEGLSWRENIGGVTYGPKQVIDPSQRNYFAANLFADIDGDGISDVISSDSNTFRIQWHKGSRP